MKTIARLLLALTSAATFACGPVNATSVVADAEVAVSRAHAAEADKYAVYEGTAADLYLQKAREEQGRANYGSAADLAKRAVELADAAAKKAAEAKKQPSAAPPAQPANIAHPPIEAAPPPPPAVSEPPPPKREVIVPRPKEPIEPEEKK